MDKQYDLTNFQAFTRTTAIYPGAMTGDVFEVCYLTLGLCDEVVEVRQAYQQYRMNSRYDDGTSRRALIKELGDVAWYIHRLLDVVETDACVASPVANLIEEMLDLLSVNAGQIAGLGKKVLRDGSDLNKNGRAQELLKSSFQCFVSICYAVGSTPEEVLTRNENKLTDRKGRGVLGGSGDER